MSIVGPWLPEARVLDLFAGSGALGLEALSRGAAVADLVDVSPESVATIRANADRLGAGTAAVIHRADALRFAAKLGAGAYDIAFADPPYDLALATRLAERWLDTPFASILGVEHRSGETLPGEPDTRRYGSTTISFYGLER
jgi:16S rRNA (guanine966-N2)-methyltransferase